MNISQASQLADIPTKTVRYYADIGLVEPASRSGKGYRIYDDASVKRLIFARRAREFGFSIEQCRELLGLYENKNRTSADVKKIAKKRLSEIERKQVELAALQAELQLLVSACLGDEKADCPIIDYLG